MRKVFLLTSLLMLLTSAVFAQTLDPCGQPLASSGSFTTPTGSTLSVFLVWCSDSKDDQGVPVTITNWGMYVDSSPVVKFTATPVGAPNAAGYSLYQASIILQLGTHSYQMTAFDAQGESVKSLPPFSATLSGPVVTAGAPKAPSNVHIRVP